MELMGPLLLALLLPQTLGFGHNNLTTHKNNTGQSDIKNKAQKFKNNTGQSDITGKVQKFKGSDLQSVFADISCNKCITCMERAITAHKINNNVIHMKNTEVLNHLNDEIQRKKRKVGKKTKRDATARVAKYYANGKLYALKVKDSTDDTNTNRLQRCDVYKIEHFYPCNTMKANLVLKGSQLQTKTKNKEDIDSKGQANNKTV